MYNPYMIHKPTDLPLYDVAVIGGGPAGMIAAGRAAECGARVILVEKNKTLGVKLLLTGGGRCNFTNAELDTRSFLLKLKKDGKFLFSPFSRFGVKETIDFFHMHDMPTKIEDELRAFPKSDDAISVLNVLIRYMNNGNVTIMKKTYVSEIISRDEKIISIKTSDGKEIHARNFIFATGGKSHPETGSTGDGFLWLENLGHEIIPPSAALVPIVIKDSWIKNLQGISLQNVKLTVLQNGAKQNSQKGKLLFTHFGISGPLVLNMSREVGECLKNGPTELSLDVFPTIDGGALDKKIHELLTKAGNKKVKNIFEGLIPNALALTIFQLSKINADTNANTITREERLRFVKMLKNMPIQVSKLLSADKAIVTSGGVILPEIDFKTMRSRKIQNCFLVGDLLNIDRPSGGYSLQICWTTGYIAGERAGKVNS